MTIIFLNLNLIMKGKRQKVTSSLLGISLIYLASQMWLSGFLFFKPYFYAYRNLIYPEL